jgi:hypothetical protein
LSGGAGAVCGAQMKEVACHAAFPVASPKRHLGIGAVRQPLLTAFLALLLARNLPA